MATNPFEALRLSIRNAPNPHAALLKELAELQESLPYPASALPPGGWAQLRSALDASAECVAQECRRCLLVYLDAEAAGKGVLPRGSLGGTAAGIGEAAARLVAVAQALGTHARLGLGGPLLPGACFCEDMHSACRGLLRAAAEFAEAAQGCSAAQKGGDALVAACKQRLTGPCARVAQWSSENVRRVPKTLSTAVKRRFLAAMLILKSSATDLRAETGVAAAAAASASASASASAPPAAPAAAIVNGAVAMFKAHTALLTCASALADVAIPQQQQQLGAPPLGGAGAGAGDEAEGMACHLDAVACACRPLEEAVIDLASAVSDAYDSLGGGEGAAGGDWGEELNEGEEGEEGEEEEEGEAEGAGEGGEEGDEDLSSPADRVAAAVAALREALAPVQGACQGLHRVLEDLLLRMEGLGVDTQVHLEALHAGSAQCREAEAALRQHLGAALQQQH